MHLLAADRSVGGAAAHREVVASDDDRPPIDAPAPKHEIGRQERLQFAIRAVLRFAGEGADFVEAAWIEQRIDALAHRELASIVLALDLVRSAHLPRQRLAAAQFFDIGFPAHASTLGSHDYTIGQW